MCFRPSAVAGESDQIQQGTCPSCGMPVAASVGIDAGTCPHCGKPIPTDATAIDGTAVDKKKIL